MDVRKFLSMILALVLALTPVCPVYAAPDSNDPVVKIEAQNKTESVDLVYGTDKTLDAETYVTKDYDGVPSVSSSSDTVSIKDMTVTILSAGTAKVVITMPETETYEEDTVTLNLKIAKKDLGKLKANQIDWDATEKTYDGNTVLNITGKVKASAGVEGEDEISVTAKATADSEAVGKHASKLSDVSFSGNENYDVSLDEDGPEISITRRDLDVITADMIKWEGTSKIYDGTPDFSLRGTVKSTNGVLSDENITVTAKGTADDANAGTHSCQLSDVQLSGAGNYSYTVSENGPDVTIEKKDLGTIADSDISWKNTEKVYDGSKKLSVQGTITGINGMIGDDQIDFTAKVEAKSANVGTHASTVSSSEFNDTNNYTVAIGKAGPEVTITKKDVVISLRDQSVVYGEQEWYQLRDQQACPWALKDMVVSDLDAQLQDELLKNDLDTCLDVSVKKDAFSVGIRKDVLTIAIKNADCGNYNLTNSDATANIVVAAERMTDDDVWSHVLLKNAGESGVFMNDDHVLYIRPGTAAVLDNDLDRYDQTFIKKQNGSYNGTLSIDADAADGSLNGNLYFASSKSEGTRSVENNIPSQKVMIDGTYPNVSFENSISILNTLETTGGKGTFKEIIRFEKYLQDGYTVKVSSSDNSSGLKTTGYAIVKMESQNDAVSKINALIQDDKWKTVEEGKAIDVPGDNKGYYVLCVRAEDMVGNAAVYTSTGLVIEASAPSVSIEGITDGKIYADDVSYSIKVSDPGSVSSGLASVDISVMCDGEKVENGGGYKNSFHLDQDALDGLNGATGDTFESVKKRSGEIMLNAFVLASTCNSNNIEVVAKVTDKSGNAITVSKRVMIDTTEPQIEVSYDNNDVKNRKYFNQDRVMIVTYRERNFDESLVSFVISVNGTEQTYSIADIRTGKVSDVSLESDKQDSQDGSSVYSLTDERTVTYGIRFGNGKTDIDYTVRPQATDLAGNANNDIRYAEGTVAEKTFTVDEVAPVMTMLFFDGSNQETKASTDKSSPLYDRVKITVRLQATERNFRNSLVHVAVAAWNAKNAPLQAYSRADDPTNEEWNRNGNVNSFTMPVFSKDANYSIDGSMEDLAGNSATYKTRYFTVDQTPPTGKIHVRNNRNTSVSDAFWSKVRFWLFDRVGFGVTHEEDDATSGIASVKCYIWHPDVNSRRTFSGFSSSELSSLNWKTWIDTLLLNPDSQSVVYMRVEDKAGNVTYINTRDGVVSEATAPQITIRIDNENQIFNHDVPFTITVTDPENGGTYAGLKDVSYTITSAGKQTQNGSYAGELNDRTARVRSLSHKETVRAKDNNSNHVVIKVVATDYSGNTTTAQKKIAIDITPPKIEVTYNLNEPRNEKYYNKVRIATVRIRERNFDLNKVKFDITSSGARPKIGNWTSDGRGGESDDSVNTCTVTFDDSADYTFTVSCTDKANNMSSYTRRDVFTVDLIKPAITVTFDNNRVENGRFYNKNRVATITVREHNFSASDFTKEVYATLADAGIKAPDITGWNNSGDMHSTSIRFDRDGDYRFDLHFTDLAGNKAQDYQQSLFTVDTTAPTIELFNVEDKHAYNNVITPRVIFRDVNLDKDASVSTTGAKHATNNFSSLIVSNGTEGSIEVPDLGHLVENDDIYTLDVVIKDLAGNKADKTIQYSVNRFGSNFTFSPETAELFDHYYLNKEQPLVIYETNVSDLQEQNVSLFRDGEVIKLNKGTDYKSVSNNDSFGWKVYQYTINPENFTQEGIYEVLIQSIDSAGNRQDNRIKQAEMQLAIDKTAPSAVVTGIENNGRYKEFSRDVNITVSDNIMPKSLTIMKNDQSIAEYDEKDFDGSSVICSIGAENDWQNISVVATDMAGNQYVSKPMRVLITPVGWRQYINNKPAVAVTIAALAAAIAALIILLQKKKKKEES